MKKKVSPIEPPPEFMERMRRLLPDKEFSLFLRSFENPPAIGLRVNTLKISVEDFISIAPFPLVPAGDWDAAAFLVTDDSRPGRHPFHDAGLYYLQDPSAMVAAALLAPSPGDLVLDLAAAPGGKATHLAALMNPPTGASMSTTRRFSMSGGDSDQSGLLIANDVHAGRARLLAENLERWGASDTITIQDDPDRIAATFGPIFDALLIDAPCSGEGMFRRQEGIEWSPAIVEACARRQGKILATAPRLVRPGGRLLYATCTFAPEENEQVIASFLSNNPEFHLEKPQSFPGFKTGRPEWADAPEYIAGQLDRTFRLWPHHFPGGGHFLALMRRDEQGATIPVPIREFPQHRPAKHQINQWQSFARSVFSVDIPVDRLHEHQDRLYLLPRRALDTGRLRLVRTGILLGESRSGYFRPAHELALALRAVECHQSIDLSADDPVLLRYLAGADIEAPGPDGWVLVTVAGFGLGWGKRVNDRLKNHFPRSLRRATASLPMDNPTA